jgi:putative peptide maturation system protein
MDLIWEEESYDGSVHYDLLLHLAGEGTVSLSFCPERALPWPMRGVRRWSEADLARVNEIVLKVEHAVALLDFVWDESALVDRLVNSALVREEHDRNPIVLSAEEVQAAVDNFRRARRLNRAEDTFRWLERRGLNPDLLAELATGEALVAKVRERVAAGRVEAYFERHRADFDLAHIALIEFRDGEDARRSGDLIRGGAIDFLGAARRRFLEEPGSFGARPRETFATIRRGQASPELAAAVFAGSTGEVVGPLRMGESHVLAQVLSLVAARLDEPTRISVVKALFEEWLSERRREARIEWYWGRADQGSRNGDCA